MDMRLASDDWDLVSRQSWLERSWQKFARVLNFRIVVAIVLLVLLLYADMPDGPVIVTDELSFEVVNQMEEAGRVCRLASEAANGTTCAGEVWKACHLAKQDLANSSAMATEYEEHTVGYLCDHAVTADAGVLAMALASRYRKEFFGRGWFKTVNIDAGKDSFLLFLDLFRSDFLRLSGLSFEFSYLASNPGEPSKISRYDYTSDDSEQKLLILLSSIGYHLRPYRSYNYGSVHYPNLAARGVREDQNLWAIGENRWVKPSGLEFSHEIIEQNCTMARLAARENQSGWDELLDGCFQLADDCANRADSFSVSCSLAKGAAEFESMWQRLPEVCATSEGNDEQLASTERTSNIEEPTGVGEPASDACYQAALAICEYQNVSPDDEWIDQLISMRDFACAAAARTPDLLYVKIDDRVPSQNFQPQS